jgi:hypothetical protein
MIKLYHGTMERIAKAAPLLGIKPYEVGNSDSGMAFSDPKKETLHLTSLYAAFQSFMVASADDKWGIVQVNPELLVGTLVPASGLMKGRGRKSWQDSVNTVGMCILRGHIPPKAITKIVIYDPKSNWLVTRAVMHLMLGPTKFKEQQHQLTMLHRWFSGEFFFIEEWLGPDKNKFTKEQRDEMGLLLNERSGLDVFFNPSVK